jgi:cytochrome subunit of sulfide dehydrogenase
MKPIFQAVLRLTFSACVIAISSVAAAQSGGNLKISQLASSCTNCHGTNGAVVAGSPVVGLAGYDEKAMIAAMKAFKEGTRSATIMHQISKGYTDEQIAQMAAFFAAQKR